MKKIWKLLMTSLLSLCLCVTTAMPIQAANENNTQSVTFSATLDTPNIQVSGQDQTVIMRVNASAPVSLTGIGGTIVWNDALNLSTITNDDTRLNFNGCVNIENGKIDFYDANLTEYENVTSIVAAAFTVPANTPAGTYEVGMQDIEMISWDAENNKYVAWESTASATATLTITEAAVSEAYTVGISAADNEVSVGESSSVQINVSHASDTVFAAGEFQLSYDAEKLEFAEAASTLNGATVKMEEGSLTLADYGEDQNLTDTAYTLVFTAKKPGATTITLISAKCGDSEDAETNNLTEAVISTASAAVTINRAAYAVTLPDIFIGPETAEPGADYTFTVADGENYDYSDIEATVYGQTVDVTDNGDGSYTITGVSGPLVIIGNRTEKTYSVMFAGTGAADITDAAATATYGADYRFTMPAADGYTYTLDSITIGGSTYTGYSVENSVYTIPGTAIAGELMITVSKTTVDAGKVTITVEGTGAGAADGYEVTIDKGSNYTLTITPESGYSYTVTAIMDGKPVDVTDNGDNTYTVKSVTGNIVFTVEKTVVVDGVSVSQYLTLNGSIMWLVKNDTTLEEGKIPTYDGSNMLRSEKYNSYCYLVVADTLDAETAAAKVGIVEGTAVAVDYTMDVNKTGKVDANDAQLTYNMYNTKYNGFIADVTMEKFLRADVNGNGKVNTEDAAAIITAILNPAEN